jgi:putative ABC transport system permease protein
VTRAIFRKALSDIRGRPLQVTLLFLVIAAAATTLSVALNVQASAAKPYDRLREESNGADIWLSVEGENTDLGKLKDFKSVAEIGEPHQVSWENYAVRNGEKKQELAIVGMGPTLPAFDHPVVTAGRWLNEGSDNEIVLDSGAAKVLDFKVGETVDLLTPHGTRTFTLVGFAVTASRNPAPIENPSFAYVLPQVFDSLTPADVDSTDPRFDRLTRVGVRFGNGGEAAFAQELDEVLGHDSPLIFDHWQSVREVSREANQFDIIFLQVFAIFALFASGLIIANAVGGQVLTQLHDIGILKAIGFTPRQVTATLLVQNLALSLLAAIAGVFAGLMLAPFFLKRSADILGVPATASFDPVLSGITVAVIAFIVALFTFFPAWRAGRVSAIDALDGNRDGAARVSRLGQLAARLRLPRAAVVGVKDLSRRPARSAMTVAALVIAVVTATFSLGIESTFDKTMSDPTVIGGPPYDLEAERDTFPDDQARRVLAQDQNIETFLAVLQVGAGVVDPRATAPGATGGRPPREQLQGVELWGMEGGDLNDPAWAMRQGRMPEQAGEAAISTNAARKLGISVGDTVEVVVRMGPPEKGEDPGQRVQVHIIGTFVSASGEVMQVLRETIPGDEPPTAYMIKTRPGADDRAVANALITASGGNLDLEVYSETIKDIRDEWRPVLLGLNLVLFVIAGINLLSSQLLSIRERRRDFAILKTLGFTPAQIVATVLAGGALLALAAFGIGIPLGLVASRIMFDILSSAAGIGTGVGELPGIIWLAPLLPLVVLVTAIASALPARIASSLEVAEALRYE